MKGWMEGWKDGGLSRVQNFLNVLFRSFGYLIFYYYYHYHYYYFYYHYF